MRSARAYSNRLLDAIDPADWYRIPTAGVSHVGWQVAHVAAADYRLCLDRIRGARPEDDALISQEILTRFGKGSVPVPDASANPSVDEIRGAFDRVRNQALEELASLTDAQLDEKVLQPHPLFDTKYGAIQMASRHEMLHAGQIGLLRRQLGADPIR
jgi:uncharacterized damage-inducible protein DinB